MKRFVFDMETGDPDDVLTLILLLGHPKVDLCAVTVTPGTPHQIGIVRHILEKFGRNIPVGAFNLDHMKALGTPEEHYVSCVSGWHYNWLGEVPPSRDASPGWQVLHDHLNPSTMLLTGAPLKNLGEALRQAPPHLRFPWTAQGGFVGEGVVPAHLQLEKFKGRQTCPTYNFNGDTPSALLAMEHPALTERHFISKNVCHGVVYDHELHDSLTQFLGKMVDQDSPHGLSLNLIHSGMSKYLRKHPSGKAFHDPLASCCAINPSVGSMWAKVRMFKEKGGWGAVLAEPDDPLAAEAIVAYDREIFIQTLFGQTEVSK